MNHLIIRRKPMPGIFMLEIFEPSNDGIKISYPVSLDGKYMLFEKNGINEWTTKGMASFIEPGVIKYIIDLIEDFTKNKGQ